MQLIRRIPMTSSQSRSSAGLCRSGLALAILAVALSGCAKKDASVDTAGAAMRTGSGDSASAGGMSGMPMQGMEGMKGMAGGDSSAMGGMTMMADMQKQMDAMMKASPEQMKAMLPMHRQMAANMLAQMNTQMRTMNMPANAAWTATVDSVRQDLVRLPEQSAQQLKDAMPAHHARMMRLMQMHGGMMREMKM